MLVYEQEESLLKFQWIKSGKAEWKRKKQFFEWLRIAE